jgi:hypothetical protein
MFYIIQEEINGIWGASSLSDPKRMIWLPDGTVQIQEHVPDNVGRRPLFSSAVDGYQGWIRQGGVWQSSVDGILAASAGEDGSYFTYTLWGADLALEAEIEADQGGVGSLIVRVNPSALAGYRVSLDFDRKLVGFYLRFPGEPDRALQDRPVDLPGEAWHHLKVVAQGNFFEIYVDEVLTIVYHQRLYESGCFGLHARGSVRFRNVQAYRYIGPEGAAPDWHSHCRPRHLFP